MTIARPVPNVSQDTAVRDFGLALSGARTKKGYSQRDVARQLGLGKITLQEMEDGLLCPDAECFKRMASIFPSLAHHGEALIRARQSAASALALAKGGKPAQPPPEKRPAPLLAVVAKEVHVPAPPAPKPVRTVLDKAPVTSSLGDKLAGVKVTPAPAAAAPPPPPSFGAALRKARMEEGLSQIDLGKALGVHSTSINHWEANRMFPGAASLERLQARYPSLVGLVPGDAAPSPHRGVSQEAENFGRAIALARASAGLDRFALASKVDVDVETLMAWEAGTRIASKASLEALGRALPLLNISAAPTSRYAQKPGPKRGSRQKKRVVSKSPTRALARALQQKRTAKLYRLPPGETRRPFGEALRREREASSLSARALAELLSVDEHSVSSWEKGKYAPRQAVYDEILSLFPKLLFADSPRPFDEVFLIDPPPASTVVPTMLGPTPPAPAAPVTAPPAAPAPAKKAPPMPPAASVSAPAASSFASALQFMMKAKAVKGSKDAEAFVSLLRTMRDENVSAADVLVLLEMS